MKHIAVTAAMQPHGVLAASHARHLADSGERSVRIQLLKGFQLTAGGRPVSLPGVAERLLALLSLSERPLRRNSVAGILWADASEERAGGNLRTTIWRSRQPGFDIVECNGCTLQLAADVDVDAREMTSQAERLLGTQGCRVSDYDCSNLTGDLLPFWDDDWVLIERERLRQLRLHALESLCLRLTAEGRAAQAIAAGLAAVQAEPLRESAHRAVIAAHLSEGNQSEALAQYRFFRNLLHDELGLQPSAQMERVIRSLTCP
jgi:DNA-binding SARP family transcriptional activator